MTTANRGKNETGKDYNYFEKHTVTTTSFPDDCQTLISFNGPHYLTFILESGTNLQYSFNGNTVHGEMLSSVASTVYLNFGIRRGKKIWFKVTSGSSVVRVEAWSAMI